AANRLFSVFPKNATAKLWTEMHAGYIADIHRCTARSGNRNVLDVAHRMNQAEAAHDVFHIVLFGNLGSHVVVAALNRVQQRAQSDSVRAKLYRIDIDLVLPHEAADTRNLGNTGNGIELVANEPVLQRTKRAGIVRAFHRIPKNLPDAGSI